MKFLMKLKTKSSIRSSRAIFILMMIFIIFLTICKSSKEEETKDDKNFYDASEINDISLIFEEDQKGLYFNIRETLEIESNTLFKRKRKQKNNPPVNLNEAKAQDTNVSDLQKFDQMIERIKNKVKDQNNPSKALKNIALMLEQSKQHTHLVRAIIRVKINASSFHVCTIISSYFFQMVNINEIPEPKILNMLVPKNTNAAYIKIPNAEESNENFHQILAKNIATFSTFSKLKLSKNTQYVFLDFSEADNILTERNLTNLFLHGDDKKYYILLCSSVSTVQIKHANIRHLTLPAVSLDLLQFANVSDLKLTPKTFILPKIIKTIIFYNVNINMISFSPNTQVSTISFRYVYYSLSINWKEISLPSKVGYLKFNLTDTYETITTSLNDMNTIKNLQAVKKLKFQITITDDENDHLEDEKNEELVVKTIDLSKFININHLFMQYESHGNYALNFLWPILTAQNTTFYFKDFSDLNLPSHLFPKKIKSITFNYVELTAISFQAGTSISFLNFVNLRIDDNKLNHWQIFLPDKVNSLQFKFTHLFFSWIEAQFFSWIEAIQNVNGVEYLQIEGVEIPENTELNLSKFQNLKKVTIITPQHKKQKKYSIILPENNSVTVYLEQVFSDPNEFIYTCDHSKGVLQLLLHELNTIEIFDTIQFKYPSEIKFLEIAIADNDFMYIIPMIHKLIKENLFHLEELTIHVFTNISVPAEFSFPKLSTFSNLEVTFYKYMKREKYSADDQQELNSNMKNLENE